jgi:hypothetical protein
MPVRKSDQRAVDKYKKANYDRVEILTPKGKKEIIKKHAERYQPEIGEKLTLGYSPKGSVGAFINRAIDETMKRDNAKEND